MLLALSELGGDKAPRPDGFLKFFWPIIRGEVMHLFEKFYLKDCIVRSLNVTFFVLIPKKGGAKDVKYFKSMSPVGNLYKLLAKALANRIKRVIGPSGIRKPE